MPRSCPTCQAPLTPKSRFCPACGANTPLEPTADDTPTTQTTPAAPDSSGTRDAPETAPGVPSVAHEPPPAPTAPARPPESAAPVVSPPVVTAPAAPLRATRAPFGEAACPFALSLNFPHALVAGHSGTLMFRAENEAPVPFENIEVYASSRGFAGEAQSRVRRLPAGGRTEVLLELEAARAGHFVLQVAVSWDQGGQRYAYQGQHPIRIYKAPDNSNIVINISDIQSNTGGGANQALGAEYGDVQISNLIAKGAIKSVNDLLDLELPEAFHRIALELDYEVSRQDSGYRAATQAASLRIPPALLATVQPALVCTLEAAGAAAPILPLRLVARPQFRLGRARAEADFVTWVLPRNTSNDEKSLRVSKVHAIAEATVTGIVLRDNASANGTLFDGVPLDEHGTSLPRQGRLLLAGAVEVDFDRLAPGCENGLAISNDRNWSGPAVQTPLQRGAVRFEVVTPETQPHNALWLLSDAAFGTNRSNALRFDDPQLAEVQGRFHHHRGCFWLETLADNSAVQLDRLTLRPGEIAPLATGMQLRIGSQTWRVKLET